MQKTFCDICGSELKGAIENISTYSLTCSIPKIDHHMCISVVSNGATKKLDICKYCVIDAINKLDDRPKERAVCAPYN